MSSVDATPRSIFAPCLLADETTLITGGGSGINLAIAHRFAQHGANLILVGRTQDKLDRAVSELESLGAGKVMGIAADVRNAEQVAAAVARGTESLGPLDIVVAGAAGNFIAPANDLSPNGFAAVVNTDLMGTFNTFRLAFPALRKPGARLLAISAPQGAQPRPGQSHACSAKAGVEMLLRTLALEWGPLGVRVNGLSPGPIDGTEGIARLAPTEEARQRTRDAVPLRRLGGVDEIADAALFLVSTAASYLTGHILAVDGGISLAR